ncbi:hypothetical protein [Streptococcus equinus]|uniref:hypothetical protein n=1 Tax=Streptococcus equinus TaxID=1335 RepID=UPI003BF785AB
MKRVVVICSTVVTICLSLMIVNLFRTNEIIRINNIEEGIYSQKFYVPNSTKSHEEVLEEFSRLSRQYKVSFVKSSSDGDTVIKSVVLYPKTFPSDNFGVKKVNFSSNLKGSYANTSVNNQLGTIKTFMKAKKIKLINMVSYFSDESHSVNGSYTIVSTYEYNKKALLSDLSDFFGVSVSNLIQAKTVFAVGYVNQELIIMGVILCFSFLLLVLGGIYYPLFQMRIIGVKKLVGYANSDIFLEFLAPVCVTIIAVSLIFDLSCLIFLDTFPKYFFMGLVWGQFSLLLFYGLISIFTYTIIQNITVSKMLKGFSNFKLGLWFNYVLKFVMTMLIASGLIVISQTLRDIQQQIKYQREWDNAGNSYLTVENFKPSDYLWENFQTDAVNANKYFEIVFHKLEQRTDALYIKSELINPSKRFGLTKLQSIPIMTVNRNFLSHIKLDTKTDVSGKVFLVPRELGNKPQIKEFLQQFYHSQLSYEEQERTEVGDLSVQIVFYDEDISVFPYSETEQSNFTNPIFAVLSDNLLFEEAAYLSTTGVSNPIKIPIGQENLVIARQIIRQQGDGTEVKFSSLHDIQQSMVESLEDGMNNIFFLIFLLLLISFVITYFTVAILFTCHKRYLTTTKFLGWKLIDRYKSILTVVSICHILALFLLIVMVRQPCVILAYMIYLLIDVTLVMIFGVVNEKRSISQQLKRGKL